LFNFLINCFSKKRIVILHNHLFKNAGSTIDAALKLKFKDNFVDDRNDFEMINNKSYLLKILSDKKIKALSSHHIPIHPILPSNVTIIEIIMFRHPLNRVASVYNFERKHDVSLFSSHPGVQMANKLNIEDYVKWRLKTTSGGTIRNFHMNKIFGNSYKEKGKNEIIKRLESITLLGIVENFNQSMVLFEETLSSFGIKINLKHLPVNMSENNEHSKFFLKKKLSSRTYENLIQKNKEDLLCYKIAEDIFLKRLKTIKNFQKKLQNYAER